jgi:hypothetical protein
MIVAGNLSGPGVLSLMSTIARSVRAGVITSAIWATSGVLGYGVVTAGSRVKIDSK